MIRYIIRNKETGKYLRRTKSYRVLNKWVDNINDASLITTSSSASQIATQFCGVDEFQRKIHYYSRRASYNNYRVEVIKAGILLYPLDKQPFIDELLK